MMKILKVIHGYPMRYNAGSEIYSQTLCQELANRHEVHVFTREEDSFAPDYRLRVESDPEDDRITLHIVNNPRNRERYRVAEIDQRFGELLVELHPDIVHIGHLSHLSTSLLNEAASRGIPIVYTLHDYWVMCPRGQFMQHFPEDPNNLWAACDGQEDKKCAERCYSRYFSGTPEDYSADVSYWTKWVGQRMSHMREMTSLVDLFVAPSKYLLERYKSDFGLPSKKLRYIDYGFDRSRSSGRKRSQGVPVTFGYIGTHIPAKGIHDLIRAFGLLHGDCVLRIWGRHRGQDTEALKALAQGLPAGVTDRVEWMPEYRNQDIVKDVFNRIDAIVVPSVWVENSPLVIHEAQEAKVLVITANAGGMAEYVTHEINGLLFEHRSHQAMAEQMQRVINDPSLIERLANRGYLLNDTGRIQSIDEHALKVEAIYESLVERKVLAEIKSAKGPWRITFDTNPDTCNIKCNMCEEHSQYSKLQDIRIKESGQKQRIMPIDLLEKVVKQAIPLGLKEIIPSTMGEPLVYEHFNRILELCEQYKIKLNLTTNGTFPRLGAKRWAERIVPVTSDVKISWNGATQATQETIMVGAKWEAMVRNVKDFIEVRDEHAVQSGHRCRVTFQMTFMEANVNELSDIVRLAVDLGVDRLKGHHLWAHFPEIKQQSMRRSPAAIRRWNDAVLEVRQAASEKMLSNGRQILLENFYLLDENSKADLAQEGDCPFLGQEAWVSAEGRFNPCCAPDKERRTLGEFGSLHQQDFIQIWNSDTYGDLKAAYKNKDLCKSCTMRKPLENLS
jgi:glycosyltransferase involved in cell wall biosynthesis/MoaA/NifB/PqqE/SkfB family radical SAM enzyme